MFISKWRLAQNLENARQEGIKEGIRVGKREATECYYSTVCQLEKDNEVLTKALESACMELQVVKNTDKQAAAKAAEDAAQKMNKSLVNNLAEGLALYHKMADVAYYINGSQEESSRMLDWAFVIKGLASRMGICADVFARAYEIYDFRNSGKEGYTLKDGKIVKIEQEEADAVECPFVEEPAAETQEDCSGEEIPVCCPEVSDTPDNRENLCTVQGCCDEESFF